MQIPYKGVSKLPFPTTQIAYISQTFNGDSIFTFFYNTAVNLLTHIAVTLAPTTPTLTPTYQSIPIRITQRPTYFEKCKHNIPRHIVGYKGPIYLI
jgi:hypothetical protein